MLPDRKTQPAPRNLRPQLLSRSQTHPQEPCSDLSGMAFLFGSGLAGGGSKPSRTTV